MKIFAVLVCYNEEKYIDECITSFLNSTVPVHVVAVDNASSDGSLEKLRRYEPRITVLAQKENLGFGIGNNAGAKYALEQGADYILWQNMDTKIAPDCMEKLYRAVKEKGDNAVYCPMPETYDRIFDLGFMCCALGPLQGNFEFRKFVQDLYDHHPLKTCYKLNLLSGASFLISAKTLREAGGFCDLFFPIYYEDSEIFQRLQYFGYELYFVPEAIFYHDVEHRPPSKMTFSHLICAKTYYEALNPALSFSQTYMQSILLRMMKSLIFLLGFRMKRLKEEFLSLLMLLRMLFRVKTRRNTILQKKSIGLVDSLADVPYPVYLPGRRKK